MDFMRYGENLVVMTELDAVVDEFKALEARLQKIEKRVEELAVHRPDCARVARVLAEEARLRLGVVAAKLYQLQQRTICGESVH